MNSCFICGGDLGPGGALDYKSCNRCGHEIFSSGQTQGFILNDAPTLEDTRKLTRLDMFKRSVVQEFARDKDIVLADIGSATGRFLFQNKDLYRDGWGVEVTPEALKFSRETLGLKVVEDSKDLPEKIDFASAWHSLEHIPADQLREVLLNVADKLDPEGRLIVSVPNAESNQYRWYKSAYAYYDVPNHLHQFTNDSLDELMKQAGFSRSADIASWAYNSFGHTQSILNLLTGSHNYLYYRLKRKQRDRRFGLELASFGLLPFALVAGLALTALDSVQSRRQGVITACFVVTRKDAS